jgi:hypothetical protein
MLYNLTKFSRDFDVRLSSLKNKALSLVELVLYIFHETRIWGSGLLWVQEREQKVKQKILQEMFGSPKCFLNTDDVAFTCCYHISSYFSL